MNFSDLKIEGKRELKVMSRVAPYTISDSDYSNWTLEEINTCVNYVNPCWYIEVFP
jgi:hypothetical protein